MDFMQAADVVSTGFQMVGIAVLVIGALVAFVLYLKTLPRRRETPTAYSDLRRDLGKAILVGLELLVAADINRMGFYASPGEIGEIDVSVTHLSKVACQSRA